EPPQVRDRHGVRCLAAELPHPGDAGVDVLHVEVGADPSLAGLHVRHGDADLVRDLGGVVLARAGVRVAELPPEEAAPELAALRPVAAPDLELNAGTSHHPPLES